MHVCSYVCTKICGSPALSNWDRIFIQPGPDLDSITSGPMDRVDQGLHHCLTTCMLQIDFLVSMEGGKWMWKRGTRLYMMRKEVWKSVAFGPCALLCIFLLLLRTIYLDLPNALMYTSKQILINFKSGIHKQLFKLYFLLFESQHLLRMTSMKVMLLSCSCCRNVKK